MKKQFLIGMLVFMFAFVSGENPRTEVDIGTVIECEALEVDQMATVDNVFVLNEQVFIITNEAEVEIFPGILFVDIYEDKHIKKRDRYTTLNGVNDSNERQVLATYLYLFTYNMIS